MFLANNIIDLDDFVAAARSKTFAVEIQLCIVDDLRVASIDSLSNVSHSN